MKKNLWLIIGAVVVVAAIVASLIFVLTPGENEPEVVIPDLSGNWTVVATYTNDTPTYTDGQSAKFADGSVSFYKDGDLDTAYATSTYTINEADATISASAYSGEYDGQAHGITVSVTDSRDSENILDLIGRLFGVEPEQKAEATVYYSTVSTEDALEQ